MKEILTEKLSKKEERWLRLAMNIARGSLMQQRHGAIIVKGGSVIATAVNARKNFGESNRGNWSIHAEARAIRECRGDVKGATLYVGRIDKYGCACYARPCEDCWKEMLAAGIKKVVYTHDDFPVAGWKENRDRYPADSAQQKAS